MVIQNISNKNPETPSSKPTLIYVRLLRLLPVAAFRRTTLTYPAPPSYNVATLGFEDDSGGGGGSSSDEEGKGASQGYAPSYLTYGWRAPNQDVK